MLKEHPATGPRKFFASINHNILLKILREYIPDENIVWLLEKIISSFSSTKKGIGSSFVLSSIVPLSGTKGEVLAKKGLPLGNLTSQLFVNIYMNRFDQFVKHKLIKEINCLFCHPRESGDPGSLHSNWIPACAGMTQGRVKYIRHADDFVIFSENKKWLENIIPAIAKFLKEELKLELHPDKIFIKTIYSGVAFLGMINFPDHRILRTKTKKRMLKKISARRDNFNNGLISEEYFNSSLNSYLGILKHCHGHKNKTRIAGYW